MGWGDRVGTLEPGKFADVIGVSGDPLADIQQPEQVTFVMKDGKVIKNEELAVLQHDRRRHRRERRLPD
jgi:imidazolonepropionase-like amidohydrolase